MSHERELFINEHSGKQRITLHTLWDNTEIQGKSAPGVSFHRMIPLVIDKQMQFEPVVRPG
ncbi:hypothetical protein JCM15908A_12600 [Prevotella dentasini JCM 15908]